MSKTRVPTERSLSPIVQGLLRCPICRAPLERQSETFHCTGYNCAAIFPIIRGVPVLLNELRSVFRINELATEQTGGNEARNLAAWVHRGLPSISVNVAARRNFALMSRFLLRQTARPRVLVVGAGTLGEGFGALLANSTIELVETDVILAPRICILCDAHDLPFDDQSFDGVVAQAVLEHVVDPKRCVEEIHRVLKPQGLVYAETPFMQQVHLGRFDFSRFTHLGHRRLFGRFAELESGVACGPGMALAWSYMYFLLSFARSRTIRRLLKAFAMVTSFPLKYFDYYLADKPGALDAASGYYFLGKKEDSPLTDRDLIQLYEGAF
jgi:SAM-dependent methyltransferase